MSVTRDTLETSDGHNLKCAKYTSACTALAQLAVNATCRLVWVWVPMCFTGVLLTAQPSALFDSSATVNAISNTGIAVGITQVRMHCLPDNNIVLTVLACKSMLHGMLC